VIFAGIRILLSVCVSFNSSVHQFDAKVRQAVQAVNTSKGVLVDIFKRIQNFCRRLEAYVTLPPTEGMTDIIVKVMVEVLFILALTTREVKQGGISEFILNDRPSLSTYYFSEKFLKKLEGRSDIEDALGRLDNLTQDEVRMVAMQDLRAPHDVNDRVKGIYDKVKGVDEKIEIVIDGKEFCLQPILS